MTRIEFEKFNQLMVNKYKAKVIDKQQFKEAIYGLNRTDLEDDVYILTEGIIDSENVIFYLINDVEVLNANCKCVDPHMYPAGITDTTPLLEFMPYIVIVAEKSGNGKHITNFAKWGSFADNIFEQVGKLQKQQEF